VLGLGYWGPNLLRAASELDSARITALCDSDPKPLARFGKRYHDAILTLDADEVFESEAVDAVLLATPIGSHYELAKRALEAGKHVFVEKPLARTSGQCQELIEVAKARGLILMPGHTFLYSPPVVRVHEILTHRALGEIFFITTVRVNLGIHQSGSSVIYDLAPHDFSILRYWLGMPMFVRAIGRDLIEPGVWDVAFIDLGYASGTLVRVEVSWLAPTKLRRTVIAGSTAMAIYDDTSNEQLRIYDCGVDLEDHHSFGEHRLAYRTGDIVSPRLNADEPLRLQLQDFVNSIEEGRPPRSHMELGADVVRLVEAAELSIRQSGAAIPLDADLGERRVHDRRRSPRGMPWFEVPGAPDAARVPAESNDPASGVNGRSSAPGVNEQPASAANGRAAPQANGRPASRSNGRPARRARA